MDLSRSILGEATTRVLQERIGAVVLTIGSDKFTRVDLSRVSCFNFIAARNLDQVMKELDVKNTRDFFNRIAPSAIARPHIAGIALAVLGSAFEAKGVGGDSPLEAWVRKHNDNPEQAMVTFTTIKHREAAAASAEKKSAKARKAARKAKAHELRVERFENKTTEAADDSSRRG